MTATKIAKGEQKGGNFRNHAPGNHDAFVIVGFCAQEHRDCHLPRHKQSKYVVNPPLPPDISTIPKYE